MHYPLAASTTWTPRIWPFKVHVRGKQPYDELHRHLLVVKNLGPAASGRVQLGRRPLFWALKPSGLAFSGKLGFAETDMYWPLTHMVAPKQRGTAVSACHSKTDGWIGSLGYDGDPAFSGGRRTGVWLSHGGAR